MVYLDETHRGFRTIGSRSESRCRTCNAIASSTSSRET